MRYSTIAVASALLVCTACVPEARAATLASYTFDNTRASADTDLNSIAGDFFDGPGVVASYSIIGAPVPSLAVNYAQIDGTTEAAAVAADDYLAFTVTPAAGLEIDLVELNYAINSDGPTFGPVTFVLRSSIDGFDATIDTLTRNTSFWTGNPIDLTGGSFQNLTAATTFRIYLYDGGNTSTAGAGRIDNVFLQGTVSPVPEPSGLLLLGSGLFLLLLANRCAIGVRRADAAPTAR